MTAYSQLILCCTVLSVSTDEKASRGLYMHLRCLEDEAPRSAGPLHVCAWIASFRI